MEPATSTRSLELQRLAEYCREHEMLFRLDKLRFDPIYCFELFRRALLETSQQAWEYIVAQYSDQVERWVRRSGGTDADPTEEEDFVNETFLRFWRAPVVRSIASEPPEALGRLLQYLKKCAVTTVIDARRKVSNRLQALPLDNHHEPAHSSNSRPVEIAHDHAESAADLYAILSDSLKSEEERVLLLHKITLQKKASAVQREFPELFTDTARVYRATENLLKRLRRDPRLRAFFNATRAVPFTQPGGKTDGRTSSSETERTGPDNG